MPAQATRTRSAGEKWPAPSWGWAGGREEVHEEAGEEGGLAYPESSCRDLDQGMERVGSALCYLQYLFRTVKQKVTEFCPVVLICDVLIRVQIRIFLNSFPIPVAFKMPTKK